MSFNPQPEAQAFLKCMHRIMHACASGCGLNERFAQDQFRVYGATDIIKLFFHGHQEPIQKPFAEKGTGTFCSEDSAK